MFQATKQFYDSKLLGKTYIMTVDYLETLWERLNTLCLNLSLPNVFCSFLIFTCKILFVYLIIHYFLSLISLLTLLIFLYRDNEDNAHIGFILNALNDDGEDDEV